MRLRYPMGIILLAAVPAGCSHRAPAPKPVVAKSAAATKATVPLPDWAPRNPSPEFLRAAKVLKPLPRELGAGPGPNLAMEACEARLARTYLAAWEFFGTLTDEQVRRLLAGAGRGEEVTRVLMPVRSMPPKQRAALDAYFETWRRAMANLPAEDVRWGPGTDRLVTFYRNGVKEDLSNLDAGFNVASHSVNITFRIHKPDGTVLSGFGCTIATI